MIMTMMITIELHTSVISASFLFSIGPLSSSTSPITCNEYFDHHLIIMIILIIVINHPDDLDHDHDCDHIHHDHLHLLHLCKVVDKKDIDTFSSVLEITTSVLKA